MGKKESKEFKAEIKNLKTENNFDEAVEKFNKIAERYKEKYYHYIEMIQSKSKHYLTFIRFEENVRYLFYTTNTVEAFNNAIGLIRKNSGGFFQSKKMLQVNCYLKRNELKNKEWKNGDYRIKGNLYQLRQMFASVYGELPKEW